MASSKSRQRKLARAKMERQLAKRAAKARRRRQIQAGTAVGIAALLLIFAGLWFGGVFSSKKATPAAQDCLWTPSGTSAVAGITSPPTTGIAKSGTDVMTISTDQGVVTANIDLAATPCTGASLAYLAGKNFYSGTTCTRLTTAGTYELQCGAHNNDATDGPGYVSIDENVPNPTDPSTDPSASAAPSATPSATASSASPSPTASDSTPTYLYPRGTVVMAPSNGPNSNGSQFIIIYQDSRLPATYTIVATVTAGMDVVDKIAAGGVAAGGASATDGAPNTPVTISALTIAPYGATPSASPSGTASPSESPSATAPPTAAS